MEEKKRWWESKTEWAALIGFAVVLLVNVLPTLGIDTVAAGQVVQEESGTIIGHILAVVSAGAYAVAFYGRLKATKKIG